MTNQEYSLAVKHLQNENRKFGLFLEKLKDAPVDQYPGKNPPFEVWRSMHYLVQLFNEDGGVVHITVNRTMIGRNGDWLDGIGWDDLQSIKRMVGMGDRFAVEVYPEDEEIVNEANMRHMWVLPDRMTFAWTK